MAKFSKKTSTARVINYAGGESFKQTDKLEFASILLTSFLTNQYYRSENDTQEKITELINSIKDKKFVAKTAIYARNEFGMRSVTHLVAAILAKTVKGEQWTKNFYEKIIHRVDDITEIIAAYGEKPLANSLKKGLRQAFDKFNEYQLAKYRGEGNLVSLVDAVNLLHPVPTEKNGGALKKLVKGQLKSFDTWETELTKAGSDENAKTQVWVKLIKEKKIGYFALLRNLRNIIEQAPKIVTDAIKLLTDETLIRKSLVLPFRFSTALEQIEQLNTREARQVLVGLNQAVDIAVKNVPVFKGETLVVVDSSGSMEGKPAEIASLFAAILVKSNNADLILFSDDAHYKSVNPTDSVLTIAKSFRFSMGGTNFHSIFETANRAYDRIIILSDMQGWVGYNAPTKTFADYKIRTGANPKIYSFDLQGYGTMQFPENNVYCLTGFSEKAFDIMKLFEKDKNALISEIEKIEL